MFSSVVKYNIIRFLLAMAAEKEWTATHMDVKTAYFNSELKEEIYLIPPEGIPKNHGKVWKLKKAIYGLKQSGRAWNVKVDKKLKEYGMKRLNADPCVYRNKTGKKILILVIYVDDLFIITNDETERRT